MEHLVQLEAIYQMNGDRFYYTRVLNPIRKIFLLLSIISFCVSATYGIIYFVEESKNHVTDSLSFLFLAILILFLWEVAKPEKIRFYSNFIKVYSLCIPYKKIKYEESL